MEAKALYLCSPAITLSSRRKLFILRWLHLKSLLCCKFFSSFFSHIWRNNQAALSKEININTQLIFWHFQCQNVFYNLLKNLKLSLTHPMCIFDVHIHMCLVPVQKSVYDYSIPTGLPTKGGRPFICLDSVTAIGFHTVKSSSHIFYKITYKSIFYPEWIKMK